MNSELNQSLISAEHTPFSKAGLALDLEEVSALIKMIGDQEEEPERPIDFARNNSIFDPLENNSFDAGNSDSFETEIKIAACETQTCIKNGSVEENNQSVNAFSFMTGTTAPTQLDKLSTKRK